MEKDFISQIEFASMMGKFNPLIISEDENFRSRYMQQLISSEISIASNSSENVIPRTLVQFWDDSKSIPQDVSECMDSWKVLENDGFKYLLFDDISAKQFIAEHFNNRYVSAFEHCHHPAMRSDYFRLCFILEVGGSYIDADDVYQGGDLTPLFSNTRLKLQPLCYSISSNSMVNPIELAAGAHSPSELIFYVNNNPIIAPPNHPVIRAALERSTQILLSSDKNEIIKVQSTTGPGNLTASLVKYTIQQENEHAEDVRDVILITNWETIAISKWPLDYRKDHRNWRLWDGRNA